ncbi:Cyanovirin-N [Tuber magnatum]|uniref:Cyanovirin-N n=1 Tax=Tuber magnatum TaxID=42249 RepID=A0A317SKQ0_9PEZI|nr:Cyanovirin-N [Tuber magnatum]
MSFYASSEGIRISEEGRRTWLVGRARMTDGSWKDIKLDLDNIIGNDDGKLPDPERRLTGGGQDFTETSSNVRFGFEGGGDVPVLRARLRNASGGEQESDLNLGERITNVNGDLVFN